MNEFAKRIALAHPMEAAEVARQLRLAIKPAKLIANCTTGAVADDVRRSVQSVLRIADALEPPTELPDGTPNVRDVHAPCVEFVPGPPLGGICAGDGHYLCLECREYDLTERGE